MVFIYIYRKKFILAIKFAYLYLVCTGLIFTCDLNGKLNENNLKPNNIIIINLEKTMTIGAIIMVFYQEIFGQYIK